MIIGGKGKMYYVVLKKSWSAFGESAFCGGRRPGKIGALDAACAEGAIPRCLPICGGGV